MPSPLVVFLVGVGAFVLVLLVAALVLTLLLGVPWQARRRGHGFASWFGLQLLALNPLYPLILVAMLPDRAKARMRERFAAELDAKLGTATAGGLPSVTAVTDRSVGDLPTAAPEGRSIGDDVTR